MVRYVYVNYGNPECKGTCCPDDKLLNCFGETDKVREPSAFLYTKHLMLIIHF